MIEPRPNDPDQTIDRTLATLSSATPRGGAEAMNLRLLARLHDAGPATNPAYPLRRFFAHRWAVIAIPATAALLAVTFGALHRSTTNTAQTCLNSTCHAGLAADSRHSNPVLHNHPATTDEAPLTPQHPRSNTPFTQPTKAATQANTATLSPADKQALDDTNAPSYPAPPMPLTRQERTLLRAARPGQPTELAQLEPLRELALHQAAKAHDRSSIERYVQRMLAPIALSQSLNLNSSAEPQPQPSTETTTPASDPNQP